ncbi:MAG: ribosome biogenesis GTPase Der [Puniceicoccaceae bacterium]|nr:MAG: ribosome biogenesis GTPase Der [Puniceicoccaceae bacterium]
MTGGRPVAAIVGRPNVGKSRLFNRLARRRLAIVHDEPGITRDVVPADLPEGWQLLDTGGLGLSDANTPAAIAAAVETQVEFAIGAADLILFVLDGRAGLAPLDREVALRLRAGGKPVLIILNKADQRDALPPGYAETCELGMGDPIAVSAEHGHGESELRARMAVILNRIQTNVVEETESAGPKRLKIAFIGRPNVGKSSLGNRLLRSERLIVSDVPGTTRDAVELDFDYRSSRGGEPLRFRLVDTAGIRASAKLGSPVEYFSRVRSLRAIEEAEVVFLVLDATEGANKQDKAIAGEAVKRAKPLIIVVNKWDLARQALREGQLPQYASEAAFRKEFSAVLEHSLFFAPGSPILFVSALEGFSIGRLLREAVRLDKRLDQTLPTGRLNAVIQRLTESRPPPRVGGKRFRVYYSVQTGNRPFRIRLFCNQTFRLGDAYRRYLESGLVREFDLEGCPMHFELRGKESRPGMGGKAE